MMTAEDFSWEMDAYFHPARQKLIEARDDEIRAEEYEARTALFALERAAHKKELREVRASALREAVAMIRADQGDIWCTVDLLALADRAERGES